MRTNVARISGSTFFDSDVELGTYHYVTRAVTASGALSGSANEVRAEIPHKGLAAFSTPSSRYFR